MTGGENPFGRPLNRKEVAHHLGCSESTVRRLVRDRRLAPPRHTPGGKPVWFERDVETYLYLLARGMWEGEEAAGPDIGEEGVE